MFMMIFPLGYSKYFMDVLLNLSPYYVVTLVNPIFIQIINNYGLFLPVSRGSYGKLIFNSLHQFFLRKSS